MAERTASEDTVTQEKSTPGGDTQRQTHATTDNVEDQSVPCVPEAACPIFPPVMMSTSSCCPNNATHSEIKGDISAAHGAGDDLPQDLTTTSCSTVTPPSPNGIMSLEDNTDVDLDTTRPTPVPTTMVPPASPPESLCAAAPAENALQKSEAQLPQQPLASSVPSITQPATTEVQGGTMISRKGTPRWHIVRRRMGHIWAMVWEQTEGSGSRFTKTPGSGVQRRQPRSTRISRQLMLPDVSWPTKICGTSDA